jgi:hypothetical protein
MAYPRPQMVALNVSLPNDLHRELTRKAALYRGLGIRLRTTNRHMSLNELCASLLVQGVARLTEDSALLEPVLPLGARRSESDVRVNLRIARGLHQRLKEIALEGSQLYGRHVSLQVLIIALLRVELARL